MNLGLLEGKAGKRKEAETHLEEALRVRGKLLAGKPEHPEYRADYEMTLKKLGELREKGTLEEENCEKES
ncbi:MAG: tetratricopeptide repeat protein, partial [Methanosarcinaceae archaeon]|nr:tetratricopeptide repeat protein [Methanosarcinaceae archaeon]